MMRQLLLTFLFSLFTYALSAQEPANNIVPAPAGFTAGTGTFTIDKNTRVLYAPNSKGLARLADLINTRIKVGSVQSWNSTDKLPKSNYITLIINPKLETENAEGYILNIDTYHISLQARAEEGIFYGLQSLFQLMTPEVERTDASLASVKVPACKIEDYPRFPHRGLHLDVGRHFFPVEFIKKYIDLMSYYKFNKFHWHLTEDQGWRLEIKKYPRLTEVGSMRKSTTTGRNEGQDSIPYGGFYTQQQAREIVAYAKDRMVTVIPEIELPGHSKAAISAYPYLSCTGKQIDVETTWGVFEDIYCAGNDQVFTFLEDVLTEVMDIFPSKYIHIGGDEAPKTRWEQCPKCQQRINDENLKDEHELQSYFVQRIERFMNAHGRQIIGWDEILEGGLAPGATVMSWRGFEGGIEAANLGHDVIMTPTGYSYLDYYQGDPETEPLSIGGYVSLETVYSFNPVPAEIDDSKKHHIIGGQGNLWTEYIKTSDHVEYMVYPRALAMAEALWSPQAKRNFTDFKKRVADHYKRLTYKDVNFSLSAHSLTLSTLPHPEKGKLVVSLSGGIENEQIIYQIDGGQSTVYKAPFDMTKTGKLTVRFGDNKLFNQQQISRNVYVHDASSVIPDMQTNISERYPANGAFSFTDGLRGSELNIRKDWLGFHGNDAEFTLELPRMTHVKQLTLGLLNQPGNWIFVPEDVIVMTSTDGKNYTPLHGTRKLTNSGGSLDVFDYVISGLDAQAKYLKVTVKNRGVCPVGHEGEGQKAWIFLDEFMVN